jgi:hypothetical protein
LCPIGGLLADDRFPAHIQGMRQELPNPADQARKRLRQIVEQYHLEIGNVDGLRITAVLEALRRFDAGLLPTIDVAFTKTPKRDQLAKHTTQPDIELRPDGWARFERAVGAAVKSGPKHRPAAKRPAREAIKKPGK